jgi:hypothetical protein
MGVSIPLITNPRLEYIVARTRIMLDAIISMRIEGFKMNRKIRRKVVDHNQAGELHKDLYWYGEHLEQMNFEVLNACEDYVRGDRVLTPLLKRGFRDAEKRIKLGYSAYSNALASDLVQQAADTDLRRRLQQHGESPQEYVIFTYTSCRMADEAVVVACSAEASKGFGDYKHNGMSLSRAKRFVYEAVLEELGARHVSEAAPEPLEPHRELFFRLCEDPNMSLLDAYAASQALTT